MFAGVYGVVVNLLTSAADVSGRHERLASAGHYAYDVIEIRVLNKKNFKFGLWASNKPTAVP